jgi:colanic acid biosynthesis glycosyl transferase WcaI
MKIFFVTQWFPPEHTPIGHMFLELAEWLVSCGYDVTVVTGFPNHPSGVVFAGYNKQCFFEEYIGEVRIWRVYLHTSKNLSFLNRALSFLTFTIMSTLIMLIKGTPQIIFSVLQPLSMGLVLPFVAKVKNARLVFNIQDLHPDAQIKLGIIKNPFLIALLKKIEEFSYRTADGLTTICDGFKNHCIACGGRRESIAVIPNWIDLNDIRPSQRCNAFRSECGLKENDFVVLYAGTIGMVSGATIMLDVASRLESHSDIKFVFVGDGPILDVLKTRSISLNIKNISFFPFQPRERLNFVQAMADISVVTLQPGSGEMSVPSKVLGYMAAARPIIASVESGSETASFMNKAKAGVVTPPEDSEAMAKSILSLKNDPSLRKQLGGNGRAYLEWYLSKDQICREYKDFFKLISERS